MSSLKEGTYYSRYRAAAIRFEVIGGVLLAAGILLNLLFSASLSTASLLIAAAGAFLLVICLSIASRSCCTSEASASCCRA